MDASRSLESGPSRRLSRTFTAGNIPDVMDPEVVPSSLAQIAPILRVANEIEERAPRVAYLCKPHSVFIPNYCCNTYQMLFLAYLRIIYLMLYDLYIIPL